MTNIDYGFLRDQESRTTRGYVPIGNDGKPIGHSGVTVATGVDIGQLTIQKLKNFPISDKLRKKLIPYVGLEGDQAVEALRRNPLKLEEEEIDLLDAIVEGNHITELERRFNKDSHLIFDDLPREIQTVLASLMLNFGSKLFGYKETWGLAIAGRWSELAAFLHEYPSKQKQLQARRQKEAALLRTIT